MASASDNNDTDVSVQDDTPVDASIDDLENQINNTDDGGQIQLEKEYELNENKTILVNKSLTFNGDEGKTIIEGNNNWFYIDAVKNETHEDGVKFIEVKSSSLNQENTVENPAKHIIFNNIIFKNIKIQTRHEMEFNNCEFINSTFKSPNFETKFDNCIFNNSAIKLTLTGKHNHFKILNCQFIESEIETKYPFIIMGRGFVLSNNFTIDNCSFLKSDVNIDEANFTITKTVFNATSIYFSSNMMNIQYSDFYNNNVSFHACKSNITKSNFNNNGNIEFSYGFCGGYPKPANFEGCFINNSKITVSKGLHDPSYLTICESHVENSCINSIQNNNITIKNSKLNKTKLQVWFSALRVSDTRIYDNDTLGNTFGMGMGIKIENGKFIIIINENFTCEANYHFVNSYFINKTGEYKLDNCNFNYQKINNTINNQTKPESPVAKSIKTIIKAPKVTNKFKKSRYFKVTVKNKDTKKAISNIKVKIKVFTGKKYKTYIAKTDKTGTAKINTKNLKIGNHEVVISSGNAKYIISAKSQIKIKK